MRKAIFWPALLGAAMLLLVSCGGSGGVKRGTPIPKGTPAPSATVFTSDDGRLTLTVPNGAVPEGTVVTITAVPADQLPEGLGELRGAGTGYRLEPDGLELSAAATVRLELSAEDRAALQPGEGVTAIGLVSLSSSGERATLADLVTSSSLTLGTLAVSGSLDHLSYLGRTRGSVTVTLDDAGPERSVGETFSVSASVANSDDQGIVTVGDVAATFSAYAPVTLAGEAELSGESLPPGAAPAAFSVELRCDDAGFGSYAVDAGGVSRVEVDGQMIETPLRVLLERAITCRS